MVSSIQFNRSNASTKPKLPLPYRRQALVYLVGGYVLDVGGVGPVVAVEVQELAGGAGGAGQVVVEGGQGGG